MCGEHSAIGCDRHGLSGSSPHVRGALRAGRFSGTFAGIIPACAGSTNAQRFSKCLLWDHPRMCGEHDFQSFVVPFGLGSSPHVRGALITLTIRSFRIGIIPACAGSTDLRSHSTFRAWDHPRMCGEHWRKREKFVSMPGSSPHVRGAPVIVMCILTSCGIIPACAGSTSALETL